MFFRTDLLLKTEIHSLKIRSLCFGCRREYNERIFVSVLLIQTEKLLLKIQTLMMDSSPLKMSIAYPKGYELILLRRYVGEKKNIFRVLFTKFLLDVFYFFHNT